MNGVKGTFHPRICKLFLSSKVEPASWRDEKESFLVIYFVNE